MAIDLTDKTIISLGDKRNRIQGKFLIAADAVADKPGLLILGNVDGSGTVGTGVAIWADNTGAIRYSATIPTDEDSSGTVIGASGASLALDNLASVAINTSLISDGVADDLGSDALPWRTAYLGTSLVFDQTTRNLTITASEPGTSARTVNFADPGGNESVAYLATSQAFTNKTYEGVSISSTANQVELTKGTATLSCKEGNTDVTFQAGAQVDVATGIAVNIDNATTIQGNLTVSATCTLDQNLSTASAPGFATGVTIGNLTLANGSITDSSGAISFGNENLTTTGNITIGIDGTSSVGRLGLGVAGTSDSYVEFDGSTLNFWDTTCGPYTLNELATGTTLNPTVGGDFTITDGNFTWTQGGTTETAVWTFSTISDPAIQIVVDAITDDDVLGINADAITSGAFIHLDTDSAASFTGQFLEFSSDGTNVDFSVSRFGATVIAGTARGTDALTLTAGDIKVTDGWLDIDSGNADGGHNIATSANATNNTALISISNSEAAFDKELINVDYNATGAYDAIVMTHLGTGYALKATGGAAGSQGVDFIFATGGTGNGIFLDGNTGTYLGSATTGMIHAHQSGTLANAASTMLRLDFDGTYASSSMGGCILVDDDGTANGTNYAVSVNSLGANCMSLVNQATTMKALVCSGPAAQTVSIIDVVGTTSTGWDGAAGVGMVNIASDGAHADVAASNLNITTGTGAMIAAARGSCLRIVDTQTLGADGFAAYISTTYNDGLKIDTGSTVGINLELQGVTSQTAPMLYMDGTTTNGWDGADATGMLHLVGKGAHANAGASLLHITESTGTTIASARGTCLSIIDTTVNGADSWVAYINTTSNDGLLINTGAVADINLKLTGIEAQTAPLMMVQGETGTGWVGAATTGMLELNTNGAIVADASLLRIVSSGQPAAANDGACLEVIETGAARATSYAVRIASSSNEALHVDAGVSLFDELITATGGVSIEDSTNGTLTIGAANELTVQNDGSTSKIIVATDALTVGATATNYTQFSTAGLQTMAGTAQPTQNIYIPAESFSLLTGSGTLAIPTGCKYSGWNMDPGTDESYSTTFYVPEDWNAAAVTAQIYWCTSDTNTNDVVFDVNTSPFAENEDTAVGHTNTDSVTDTACSATAYDLNVTATIAIAANTEWAAGDLIVLNINRDADNTADDNAADAFLIGVKITYSADHI